MATVNITRFLVRKPPAEQASVEMSESGALTLPVNLPPEARPLIKLDYVIANRTSGANPFKIFESLKGLDSAALCWAIKRMPYSEFLKSSYWFAVSTVAKSRSGMRCQVCNSGSGIQVHHRTYDTHGREHENMLDLVVLCENCHGLFHGHIDSNFVPPKPPSNGHAKKCRTIPHSESDIFVPESETGSIILTKELIDNCRANGSFTNATLRALGLTKATMTKGWTHRLLGTPIPQDAYRRAVEGKFVYSSGGIG
jgi:hypothetical protein